MLYQQMLEQSNIYGSVLKNNGLDRPLFYKVTVRTDIRIPEFDNKKHVCRGPFVDRPMYFDQILSYLARDDAAVTHLYLTKDGNKNTELEEEIEQWCLLLDRCVRIYYTLQEIIDINTVRGLSVIYEKLCYRIENLMDMTDSARRRNIVDKFPGYFEYAFIENLVDSVEYSPLMNVIGTQLGSSITKPEVCVIDDNADTSVESHNPDIVCSWYRKVIEDEFSEYINDENGEVTI